MCINEKNCTGYDKNLDCDKVTCRWPTCYEKVAEEDQEPEAKGSAGFAGYAHKDMEHWAEEYECAMKHLDDLQIPRHDETEKVFSLVGRINKAISLVSA